MVLIPVVTETKFLGLVFDRKLTFVTHIEYLKDRCLKALNLLRIRTAVSRRGFGDFGPLDLLKRWASFR